MLERHSRVHPTLTHLRKGMLQVLAVPKIKHRKSLLPALSEPRRNTSLCLCMRVCARVCACVRGKGRGGPSGCVHC